MALAMADRFEMNPRDIVYVDASGLATWNRLLGLIMPTVNSTLGIAKSTSDFIYNVQHINNTPWK